MKKRNFSTKEWLPIKEVSKDGIIKLQNNNQIKLLKVIPINFNLKSEIEKTTILESYKNFLNSCNFDIQIIIQSKKENLSKNIITIRNNYKKENKKIINLSEKYIQNIEYINSENKFCSKNYYILIRYPIKIISQKDLIKSELLIIKENLEKCGNIVIDNLTKEKIEEIIDSFVNPRN